MALDDDCRTYPSELLELIRSRRSFAGRKLSTEAAAALIALRLRSLSHSENPDFGGFPVDKPGKPV